MATRRQRARLAARVRRASSARGAVTAARAPASAYAGFSALESRDANDPRVGGGLGDRGRSASAVAAFEAAARRGDINWHAFPFNAGMQNFT